MLTSGGGGSFGDDLINPVYFPCKSTELDTSLISGSGDKVAAIGTQVLTTTQAAETSWKGLQSPGVFETPDSEVVYALMQPAVKGATDMNGVTGRISTALHTYAAELEGIKPDLADLEERAAAFRERAQKGYEVSNWEARGWLSNFETGLDGNPVPKADAYETTTISWKEHGPAVEKNKSLLREYDMILERISAAATSCANAIRCELKLVCVAPAEKITAEMLAASDLSVWGKASEEQRNCTESVGHGLGNFWHNTWTGAASLIGRDATTGEWSWETAGKTWWGVGDFVVSTLVVTSPISALLLTNEQGRSFYNDRANVAASSWGGLIGWDHQAHLAGENGWHRYEEDGVAALTESVANVGTFFIPVAGAAAGGTKAVLAGTRVGSFVAKTASHVAEFVVPAGSYLVKGTVKVIDLGADLAKGGWRGLIDSLTPGPVRPNVLPGITGVATETPHVPLPSNTPVSSSLGLEGAPSVHGSNTPGGGHVPDGSAPHGGPDGPGEVPGRGGESEGSLGGHDDGRGNTDTSTDAKNPEHGDAEGNGADGGGADTNVDAHGAHTEPHRGDPEWRVGPGDEVPGELSDLSGKRAEAIAEAQAAYEAFDHQIGAFNEALREAGMPEVDPKQFTVGRVRNTIRNLQDEVAGNPELLEHLDNLQDAAEARREALVEQRDIGEKFGEAAGRIAAGFDGLRVVMEEGSPGRGSVDQAFKTPDNSELVIQEVKGPSAQLGTAKVPGPDGGTVAATQGSDAYLRWVLRMDTQLRDKVLADSALLHGLLEGTTKLRYRLVQPNETGYVRVAEFIIDQSKLDLRGWLEGP